MIPEYRKVDFTFKNRNLKIEKTSQKKGRVYANVTNYFQDIILCLKKGGETTICSKNTAEKLFLYQSVSKNYKHNNSMKYIYIWNTRAFQMLFIISRVVVK